MLKFNFVISKIWRISPQKIATKLVEFLHLEKKSSKKKFIDFFFVKKEAKFVGKKEITPYQDI
jgi:hypothetical protein